MFVFKKKRLGFFTQRRSDRPTLFENELFELVGACSRGLNVLGVPATFVDVAPGEPQRREDCLDFAGSAGYVGPGVVLLVDLKLRATGFVKGAWGFSNGRASRLAVSCHRLFFLFCLLFFCFFPSSPALRPFLFVFALFSREGRFFKDLFGDYFEKSFFR